MIACPASVELQKYLKGDVSLGPERAERIEEHVEDCAECQGVLDDLTSDQVPTGTTMPDLGLHGYRIYKFLGSGTFGEVWLAQDLNLPRRVAVKTLKLKTGAVDREQALQALRKDADLMTHVVHPNVVQIYAWVTVGQQHYVLMQYVPGGSLADLLKEQGRLDWQKAARYIADAGEGLLEVHAQGIVHRDVKPANILWEPKTDEAVLTDFGVGAWLGDAPSISGSLYYMSPEAYDGHVSPALDVFSLAASLFHLVTGSPPFPGANIAELKELIALGLPDPDPRCRELPEPLERVIRAGLAATAEARPSLRDFVNSLRGSLNQLMADTLSRPSGADHSQTPVTLHINVSRRTSGGRYEPVATTHPAHDRLTRDMKRVPRPPAQVRLRTGERVRVEVVADRAGHLTIFNVGPAGHLNLLYPESLPDPAQTAYGVHRTVEIPDVEMTPPAGRERLFAVWSRQPLSLHLDQLRSLVEPTRDSPASRPYVATRDMKRVQHSIQQLRPEDWHAVVLELNHVP
jgi:serine/threonine protein kinase